MSDSGIFKAAVKLPPERRAAYLDQACGTNQALRREVESLRPHPAKPWKRSCWRMAQCQAPGL